MDVQQGRKDLWEDYLSLCEKYQDSLPVYEFGFAMIQFSTKLLMDSAPRHRVALDTIKAATEEGIKWHVEDRAKKEKA